MPKYEYKNKICFHEQMINFAAQIRSNGGNVVFANGCFDIVHRGHIQYLRESRQLGDCLIIGLNSDESVRKLKGDGRPINSCADRIIVLEAFDFVDKIIVFSEDTPLHLIKELKPEIYTKGGDYDMHNVIGKGLGKEIIEAYGGTVKLIPSSIGFSTTELIRKMKL